MKPFLHFALLLFLTLNLCAQDKPKTKEKKKVLSPEEEYDRKNYKIEPSDRLIFEVNHTGWLNYPSNIQMSWKSVGFNVAMMFDKPIGRSNFSIGYGIGFYTHNFHSNADFVNHYDSLHNYYLTEMVPKTNNYTVNRFAQQILEIPLELRFRTKTLSKFKIMFGGKFGYVVNDFRKVFDDAGKLKYYDTKNVNYLRYGVLLRVGFEQVCLTACYYFSDVFVKDRGLNGITPYSIGIAIIPY